MGLFNMIDQSLASQPPEYSVVALQYLLGNDPRGMGNSLAVPREEEIAKKTQRYREMWLARFNRDPIQDCEQRLNLAG
jgi:hypothetical protein